MPIEWTVRLRCATCGAEVVYRDERPEWLFEDGVSPVFSIPYRNLYADCPACGGRAYPVEGPTDA